MEKLLRVGIGCDAYYPTIDGGCTVAKCYAEIINEKLGEAVVITPNNPNAQDYRFDYPVYRYKSLFNTSNVYKVRRRFV